MAAHSDKAGPVLLERSRREGRRDQEIPFNQPNQARDPAGLIHRRPDHRKIKPIRAADVAVEHVANMQAQVEACDRQPLAPPTFTQGAYPLTRSRFGIESAPTGVARSIGHEDRQDAIADQLEYLASGIVDGRDHRLSIVVEERNDLFRSCRVGDAREVTKIAEPDDGPDAVGHAPGDAAFQNTLAGVPAEGGLDQGCGNAGEGGASHVSPVCSRWWKGLWRHLSASVSFSLVRPYSTSSPTRSACHRNTRPSWIGCSVSTSTWARAIGSPIATARSQKPRRRSSSGTPARPAWITQAAASVGSCQAWLTTPAPHWISC